VGRRKCDPVPVIWDTQNRLVSAHTGWSAEMTPVSSNDEKHASEGERNACDDRSRCRHLEGWDLSGDEPDTGKQDQQESDLGESDPRLMAKRKHRNDGSYFGRTRLRAGHERPVPVIGAPPRPDLTMIMGRCLLPQTQSSFKAYSRSRSLCFGPSRTRIRRSESIFRTPLSTSSHRRRQS